MVTDARGNIVRAPKQLRPRENVTVHLAQGTAQVGIATVQETLD
jgi:exodeoxyribonuclease VII large subunit